MKSVLLLIGGLLAGLAPCHAVLIEFSGEEFGDMSIAEDVVFNITKGITKDDSLFFIIRDVGNDGSQTHALVSNRGFSVNGGNRISLAGWCDNLNVTGVVGMAASDGYLQSDARNGVGLSVGDQVTLHAGTSTLIDPHLYHNTLSIPSDGDYVIDLYTYVDASSSIQPMAQKGLRYEMQNLNAPTPGYYLKIGEVIPEPSTAALLGIGGIMLTRIRRFIAR